MKTDLLLVQCPVWGINMPPMSLGYISAYLRKNKIATGIEDLNIYEYRKAKDKKFWTNEKAHLWMDEKKFSEIEKKLKLDFEKAKNRLLKHNPKAIGFSVNTATSIYTKKLVKEIKKTNPEINIIFGGKGVFLRTERKKYRNYADYFVIGEGEEKILELMKGIKKRLSQRELSKIKGIGLAEKSLFEKIKSIIKL